MQSDEIGEFVTSNSFSTLPSKVKERTRLAALNFMAVTIGANSYPQSRTLVDVCTILQDGQLPIFGSGKVSGLISSAWANSSLSHFLDYDDTHLESIVHPSAPVIPSALSIGINNSSNGQELLYASAMGMETAIRLALAVGLDERYSDWHNTSLFGTSASAVGSSIMLHSDSQQVSSAMLQGLTVATGFLSNRGTLTKGFQVGRSAAEGIISAIAAKNGISVSKNMINTFAASISKKYDLESLAADLGKKWNVLNNFLKPYPCGVVLHPGIDAAIIMREKGLNWHEVDRIDVFVNPVVMVLTAITEPKSGLESKFSITHAIAAALAYGPLFPEHFSDEAVKDSHVLEIRKKIKVHQVEEINRGQTIIEILSRNGRKDISEINRGSESPSKEMDVMDVRKKFSHLVEPVLGHDRSEEIWDYFSNLDSKDDISEISEIFR